MPYVLLKSGNNANIDANQKLFYLHTVVPMLTQFCSAFSHFFNSGISIRPDRLKVPALQPDNRTQAIYYSTLVNTGIITPNEAREGLRFPKLENNDTIRIPQNITGSATDATQGGRPLEGETLKEMRKNNEKTFYLNSSFETKALSKKSKSIKIAGYANTTAKDRSNDVVTAEAWAKGVDNYRKNPVLLYQHKHDCPIGRVEQITVDKKGIHVEAAVSEAAERNHGVQTLIKDGALKSFSVGFRVKDGKYNREDDSMVITDVELLEISVVSVPCNQESLFSIRKSFENDTDYEEFKKSLKEADEEEIKMMRKIKAGITDVSMGHYHTVEMDENGNGVTTYASHMSNHAHKIMAGVVMEAEGHTHDITMMGVPIHDMEEGEVVNERPMSPSEEEAMSNSKSEDVVETKAEEIEEV